MIHPSNTKTARSIPPHILACAVTGSIHNGEEKDGEQFGKTMPVPRRLFFAAQQRIAIAQSPKLHQKNQL
jgi:hypothetical protein